MQKSGKYSWNWTKGTSEEDEKVDKVGLTKTSRGKIAPFYKIQKNGEGSL